MHSEVIFYGGPFDGQTEQWPISEVLDRLLAVTPDYDPTARTIYMLRSITLSLPPRVEYAYVGTTMVQP